MLVMLSVQAALFCLCRQCGPFWYIFGYWGGSSYPQTPLRTGLVASLLVHSDSRFESIRFPQKIETSDSTVLVFGVCLPNHRSTDYRSWHGSGAPIFSEGARRTRPPARPCVSESNRTNRLESIFWRKSNRIEIIFGESECSSMYVGLMNKHD